jgi:hypothetical protein
METTNNDAAHLNDALDITTSRRDTDSATDHGNPLNLRYFIEMLRGATLLAVAIIGATPVPPGSSPRQTAAFIAGIVVDEQTARPVAGATVRANFAGESVSGERRDRLPDILTGPDGRFEFRGLGPGRYHVEATRPGYSPAAYGRTRRDGESELIRVIDGQRVDGVVLTLWKLAAIGGTVLDEAGEPVVDVRVIAWRTTFKDGRRQLALATAARTDDRGMYRIGALNPGDYVVGVSAGRTTIPAADVRTRKPFDSRPMSTPADGTALLLGDTLYPISRGATVPPPLNGGRLSIYPTSFHPSATSLTQATAVRLSAGDDRQGIDIQLHPVPTAKVEGIVTGVHVVRTGLLVRLEPVDTTQSGIELDEEALQATTDDAGVFSFSAVPAGQYLLRVRDRSRAPTPGYIEPTEWCSISLTVGHADLLGIPVRLQRGLYIHGRVEFEGTTDPSVSGWADVIEIAAADPSPLAILPDPPARVDAKGQFASVGLPPGRYVVRGDGAPPGWMFKSATVDLRDVADTPFDLDRKDLTDVVVTFTDRITMLSGVVRTQYGVPNTNAAVLIFPASEQSWSLPAFNPQRFRRVRTREGGGYQVNALPIGDYYVVAVSEDRADGWQDPRVLEVLARTGTLVSIRDGDRKAQDLRTEERR